MANGCENYRSPLSQGLSEAPLLRIQRFPLRSSRCCLVAVCLLAVASCAGCGGKAAYETKAEPRIEKPKPPTAVPMWLRNGERNFFGTGPWKDGELKVIWEVETGFISGRLHKDPWGGTSWPGQPSLKDDRVYFPSGTAKFISSTRTMAPSSGSSKLKTVSKRRR